MKKMLFIALTVVFFAACEHSPPGWEPLPDGDEDADVDSGTAIGTTDGGAIDAPADSPDAEYLPDSGTNVPAGPTDAAATDTGADAAPVCTCICEYNDGDACDHDGHGKGHWKLHCHHGHHCHKFGGENRRCENGYHCHIGHYCKERWIHGHPECDGWNPPIYDPIDTCGNPCECPGDNDIKDGDETGDDDNGQD